MVGTKEVAQEFGLSEAAVRGLCEGGMPHARVGNRFVFDIDEVGAWLEDRADDDEEEDEEEEDGEDEDVESDDEEDDGDGEQDDVEEEEEAADE